ncbi:MAG: membrane lipoprotein lipid attachment site-containing protein [Verrucomicrobia bacterium]|jgi:outer membrane biogenesis lipoprotein LolB|nr:membrane lipoprotein lipid attachment site-containing protein [Verrucomicrobiota bacterium]MBV9274394.1 membrane lipoprotein lipid attachment site-containing protein [Verrucomicrobiota bacterium]
MKRLLVILTGVLVLAGCQVDPESQKQAQTPQFGQPQSTIPWDQPQSWENTGQLGAIPGVGTPRY